MRRTGILIVALAGVMLAAGVASADEVTEAMTLAGEAYRADDYKEASTQLQTALVGVNQKLIDLLIGYLPAPPAGWKADEPEGLDASVIGMGFFAGLSVSRDYRPPGGSRIELSVAANSPMLATYRMALANPMIAQAMGQEGMKKVKVCGYDAFEEFSDEDETYRITILAGDATYIAVEGNKRGDGAHVRTLAGAINCEGIVDLVE